jgi:hypothetical protein
MTMPMDPRRPVDPDPTLAVHLRATEWNRVLTQLGEGSVNQMLALMQHIQTQLHEQLDEGAASPARMPGQTPGQMSGQLGGQAGHALRAVPDSTQTQDEAS